MDPTRMFLVAILLVVGLNLSLTAGDSSATWEDFEKSSAVWAKKEFSLSSDDQKPKLVHHLTSAALDEATPTADNDTSDSTSDGGWIAQCHNLSDDMEKSWNLTIVVAEVNWPVVENVAEILYTMILECTKDGIGEIYSDAKCLILNLVDLKSVLVPAVKNNVQFVQQAWHLIPEFVKSSKECFSFI